MADSKTLFQYGTLALLVPGLFKGTLKLSDLLKHGDTGIGTGDGLDGELIILDGKPYQVNGEGKVIELEKDFTVPFADVHHADFKPFKNVKDIKMDDLGNEIFDQRNYQNTFFSVLMHGEFDEVTTRSINRQSKPYPPLVQCADQQKVFQSANVSGTVIGYYSPQVFNGAAVGGFHLHFLADDHSVGGHLLNYQVKDADLKLQLFNHLDQRLPVDDPEYMNHDFSKDDIEGSIKHSEQ